MRALNVGLVACLALSGLTTAHAQGFGIYEHGTCAMARAGTGVAAPCGDGSSIFFNPAGLARHSGITLTTGVTFIKANSDFTDDRTQSKSSMINLVTPVPHLFIVHGGPDGFAFGLGVFAPYGLGTKWESPSTPAQPLTFEGRFNGYDNELRSIYIQPTVAFQLHDKISIGAGLDFVIGSIEINQRADLSEVVADPTTGLTFGQAGIPFHTEFADARLTASLETGYGGNFGILIEPIGWLSIGARYLTQVTIDYAGDAMFTQVPTGLTIPADLPLGGAVVPAGTPVDAILASNFETGGSLEDQSLRASITNPDQFVAGVAVEVIPTLTLLADYQWTNWTDFDTVTIDFTNVSTPDRILAENYNSTNGFRFGFDWAASERVRVRGGYLYHEEAAPPETVTPLLPDGERNEVTVGFGLNLSPKLTADVAYQYINQNDRRGRVRDALPGEPTTIDLNTGLYESRAHLAGVTFTLHF